MTIDRETKLIARLHTKDNGTGLDIYNPYFEAVGINAVYMLFKNRRPEPLISGMRNLQISGAITAGFEHDSVLLSLVDEKSEAVELAERIGIIVNRDGKLYAHYQGGEGLMSAIAEKTQITGKNIVIVGAGTVAKTLILALEQSSHEPRSIVVVNRTIENARALADRFGIIKEVRSMDELSTVKGDILINASRIGSTADDSYFIPEVVGKFQVVADVTFGDPHTNLISFSEEHGLVTISGWDMFTHQAAVVLRGLINHEADIDQLRQFVENGLSSNNHGATL